MVHSLEAGVANPWLAEDFEGLDMQAYSCRPSVACSMVISPPAPY